MAADSAEQIYDLLEKYLFPILKFANIYVDKYGILRPIGQDPSLSFQEEGRDLIIVDSRVKYQEVKANKEEFQIFNPFSVPKQAVFLANMVLMKVNKMEDENENMIYDEDLDEWILKDESMIDKEITNDSGNIKLFETRDPDCLINTKITFAKTDSSGNPSEILSSYSHQNVILSIVGAIINLIKKYQKTITPDFVSTTSAIINIEKTLNKISNTREKEKKEKPVRLHISNLEDDEELIEEIMEIDKDGYFIDPFIGAAYMFNPMDKRDQYDPTIANSKMSRNMILPSFKTLTDTEEFIQTISDSNELNQYMDMDFQL